MAAKWPLSDLFTRMDFLYCSIKRIWATTMVCAETGHACYAQFDTEKNADHPRSRRRRRRRRGWSAKTSKWNRQNARHASDSQTSIIQCDRGCAAGQCQSHTKLALCNIDDRIRRRTRKTLIEELLPGGGWHEFWDEQTDHKAYNYDQQAPTVHAAQCRGNVNVWSRNISLVSHISTK